MKRELLNIVGYKKRYIVAFRREPLYGLPVYEYPYAVDPEVILACGVRYTAGYTENGEIEYLPCYNKYIAIKYIDNLVNRCNCNPGCIAILEVLVPKEDFWNNYFDAERFIVFREISFSELARKIPKKYKNEQYIVGAGYVRLEKLGIF